MTDPREGAVTEAQVQQGVVALLRSLWWEVFRVGQYVAKGTQDAGVSDILAFHEQWGILFIECKSAKGVQSRTQKEFQAAVEKAGGRYLLAASSETVARYLDDMRRLRRMREEARARAGVTL